MALKYHFNYRLIVFAIHEISKISFFLSLQFYDLIERNQIAMSNLKLRSLTIFAPTNEAFQKYTGSSVQVQYHMCKFQTITEISVHSSDVHFN